MISSICSFVSSTYALNPRVFSISCLTCWSALIFLPGAFTSTKPHRPPGSSTNRSGIPSKPGLMNFTARPPIFFTALSSCNSISFSSIPNLPMERRNDRNKNSYIFIRVRIGVSMFPIPSVLPQKSFWYILVPSFQNLENLHPRMVFRRFLVERALEQAWNELVLVPHPVERRLAACHRSGSTSFHSSFHNIWSNLRFSA